MDGHSELSSSHFHRSGVFAGITSVFVRHKVRLNGLRGKGSEISGEFPYIFKWQYKPQKSGQSIDFVGLPKNIAGFL
jgi:hypothetical protein